MPFSYWPANRSNYTTSQVPIPPSLLHYTGKLCPNWGIALKGVWTPEGHLLSWIPHPALKMTFLNQVSRQPRLQKKVIEREAGTVAMIRLLRSLSLRVGSRGTI